MAYQISRLRLKNFKCFDNKKFYCFDFLKNYNPIILSGPNGFGKTTFFDAVELIFYNNITRFQNIEDGRTNLGRNILLNESNHDGIIVLTLQNEKNEKLNIIAIIDHQNKKLSIKDTVKYYVTSDELETDNQIFGFLDQHKKEFLSTLNTTAKLKYHMEHFNVYYYVSQAESVHFLKQTIAERKDSMNAVLNTKSTDNFIAHVTNSLIGNNASKRGVLVNDELAESETTINQMKKVIIEKMQNISVGLKKGNYEKLLNYNDEDSEFVWDLETINFKGADSPSVLDEFAKEINELHLMVSNYSDYKLYKINTEILRLVDDKGALEDYIMYYSFIENGALNLVKLNTEIAEQASLLELYNYSAFFRNRLDISLYKKEDMLKIKQIDEKLINFDVEEIYNLIVTIGTTRKKLSMRQTILKQIKTSRMKLQDHCNDFDSNSHNCPFCNHNFKNAEKLQNAFSRLSADLDAEASSESNELDSLLDQVHKVVSTDSKNILVKLQSMDNKSISELSQKVSDTKSFLSNTRRTIQISKISSYLTDLNSWVNLEFNEKKLKIGQILREEIKPYKNTDFENIVEEYNFFDIETKYKSLLSIPQKKLLKKTVSIAK